MLSSTELPQSCYSAEPVFIPTQSVCLATSSPINFYKNQLEYTFPDAPYLTNQFTNAITNHTIRDAFNRAIYNPNYAGRLNNFIKTPGGEMYTETAHAKSLTTYEGKTACVISWIEEGNEIKARNLDELREEFDKPHTRETMLFLSDKEFVFIPGTVDFGNIDQLQYYAGMRFLYGSSMSSPHQYIEADVIREVANHRELVTKIGSYYGRLDLGGYGEVKVFYQPGKMEILIEDEKHIFSKYYKRGLAALFGFFKPTVSYEKVDMTDTEDNVLLGDPEMKKRMQEFKHKYRL